MTPSFWSSALCAMVVENGLADANGLGIERTERNCLANIRGREKKVPTMG